MNDHDRSFDSAGDGARPFLEFDWYAVDCREQVAVLSSAGFGPIPLFVFREKAAYIAAAEYFESLPVRCDDASFGGQPGGASDWSEYARCGLFAYDWNCNAGQYVPEEPYRLMAVPTRPLLLQDLPEPVRGWLAPIRFDGEFGNEHTRSGRLQRSTSDRRATVHDVPRHGGCGVYAVAVRERHRGDR